MLEKEKPRKKAREYLFLFGLQKICKKIYEKGLTLAFEMIL